MAAFYGANLTFALYSPNLFFVSSPTMPSAWVVQCKGCGCAITCFAIDPQAEHMNAEASPPRDSAQVACPCCGSVYRYVAKDIFRGEPRRNEKCRSEQP